MQIWQVCITVMIEKVCEMLEPVVGADNNASRNAVSGISDHRWNILICNGDADRQLTYNFWFVPAAREVRANVLVLRKSTGNCWRLYRA